MKKILQFLFVFNFSLLAQDINKKSQTGIIFFNSDPIGAQVCVNDSLCGVTPLEVYNWKSGTYNFKFIKDSLEVNKYNIAYTDGEQREIFAVLHSEYALLSVNSVPEGAIVYLDGDSLGTTPLNKQKIPVAAHIIEIKKENYITWNTKFIAKPNLYEFAQKLDFGTGIIDIIDYDNCQYSIDEMKINNDSKKIKLNIGFHKVSISGSNLHKNFSEEFELEPYQLKEIKFNYGFKNYNPLLYSIFLPGLGQLVDGSYIKGTSIFISNFALAGLTILSTKQYNKDLDNHKSALAEYQKLGSNNEFKIIELSKKVDETYSTAIDAQKKMNLTIGIFIVAYLYNLVDAYLFHSIDGEFIITNQVAPNNSFSNNYKFDIKLTL